MYHIINDYEYNVNLATFLLLSLELSSDTSYFMLTIKLPYNQNFKLENFVHGTF